MKDNKTIRVFGSLLLIILLFVCQFLFNYIIDQKVISEKLMSKSMVLTIGDEVWFSDLLEGSRHKPSKLSWHSDGDGIIIEDDSFVCESSGEYVINAIKKDKTIVNCSVKVIARSVISLDSDYIAMGEGLTTQILPSASGGYSTDFTFISENPSVASVDDNGTVTAFTVGEARIKIKGYGCESVYCNVSVSKSPSEVTLSAQSIDLGIGEIGTLIASLPEDSYKDAALSFESSDESIATVDKNGNVTAVSKGTCEIKATAYSGASAVCAINVKNAPTSLEASVGDDSLYAGETVTIKTEIDKDAACGAYTFTSGNPAIAEVSANGVIKGKGRGSTTIEVSTYNGQKASVKVSVKIFDYMTPPISADIYEAVGYLAEFYPELITTEVIGKSVKGKDIMLLKLGKGAKKACIVAGLHAKEDIAVVFTMRCIEEYAAAYHSSSGKYGSYNIKKMLDEYTLYIVPTMNPDGLDICNAGEMPLYTTDFTDKIREDFKNNANGVNLNRNFPFRWDKTISSSESPDDTTYKGVSENSEPETQAIVKLVESNDFEWLFSMHCKGNLIYWADRYNEITTTDRNLSKRLEKQCEYFLIGPSPLKNLGGGLENWFRDKTGNPGFCIELVSADYSTEVNQYFAKKVNWEKTKYTFIQGMR